MSETPAIDVDVHADRGRELPEVIDALREQGFQGLVIAGPESAAVDHEPSLPVIGFRLFDTHEGHPVQLSSCGLVTTVHVESGRFVAARIEDARDDRPTPEPSRPPKRGEVAQQFEVDVAERSRDLPWRPGTLITTILLADRRSNRVRTRVTAGSAAEADPAVADFLRTHPREGLPEPVWPPLADPDSADAGSPRYREAGAPAPPESEGVALEFDERVVVGGPDRTCVLRGSFRLPVRSSQIVPNEAPSDWPGVGDEDATAVVPVDLLLTSNYEAGPFLLPLRLPCYEAIDEGANPPIAIGEFAIDLFSLREMPQMPQTYFVWAVAGETLSEPATLSIVTEEMLSDS